MTDASSTPSPSPPVAAGFIVFTRDSPTGPPRYLMMRSSSHGGWGVPKGHLDPGEDIETAAYRETEEEAGFAAADLQRVTGFHHTIRYQVKSRYTGEPAEKAVHFFLAEVTPTVAAHVRQSSEHSETCWAGLDEACELARFEDMQRALRVADAAISHT